MATPEGKVKDRIKHFLKHYKIDYWMPQPSPIGNTNGMSDFIAILSNGQWLAIEAKAPGKKDNTTPNQEKFLKTIRNNGGFAFVVAGDEDLIEVESAILPILRHV